MRNTIHQLFHWLTSRWIPDVWYAGPILCETRVCVTCGRSQFRSKKGEGERFSGWMETTDKPVRMR